MLRNLSHDFAGYVINTVGLEDIGCPLGPSYMVSGTRDNPPPELPWPRYHLACFFLKFNQPFTLGSRTRLGGRDNSGGRVVSPRQVG